MAALDDVESRVNQCADTILKASNMAYDTVRHFGNMQQVVSTGKAGALALADTLATAPVGDATQVRANIGAQEDGKCVVNEEYISTMGLSGGDISKPYVRKKDGNVCWLQPFTSIMSLGLGGEAWQVRQRFGLGNDESGRSAIGLGTEDNATFKGVNAKGVEASYFDLHQLGGDSVDYQVRLICDGDGHAKVYGTLEIPNLTVGGKSLGAMAFVTLATNGVGTVVQKTITDVTSKNLNVGRVAAAWEMNVWDGSKDNAYVAGTWLCTSQLATAANTWVCTFMKIGD